MASAVSRERAPSAAHPPAMTRSRADAGRETTVDVVMAPRYGLSGHVGRTTYDTDDGTTSPRGPELLIDLAGAAGATRGMRVESALREAVTGGRLAPGARMPSTRALARDLAVSRRLVVEAYAQLTAEGLLETRRGSGTFVSPAAVTETPPAHGGDGSLPDQARPPYDFFPGAPDLSSFPRAAWLRAARDVLREVPDAALHYPDPAGTAELRTALARHLARARGAQARADRIVVVTGARQGLAVLGRALRALGHEEIAVERPTLPLHVDVLRAGGLDVRGVPVGAGGLDVGALAATGADAVLATPAHQMPLGVALAPAARGALLDWAAQTERRLIIEDDYDAEFRYDRRPLGALQGRAPEHVAYLGSASKTLAPGLRLGWLLLPAALVEPVRRQKLLDDGGSGVLDQLTLARLMDTDVYDRHLRVARRRNRRRRDALEAALAEHVPGARLEGMAAGLHAIARLPHRVTAASLTANAYARGVGVGGLPDADGTTDALVLGYAGLSEPAIAEGVRRLAAALAETA